MIVMTDSSIKTGLFVISIVLLGCGGGVESLPQPSAADLHAEVEDFLGDYMQAIGARDTETLRRQLAPEGRYLWAEEGAIRYRSADEMLVGLASFPVDTPMETDIADLSVARVGTDGAHAAASFTTRIGEGQGAFSFGGLMTFVLERDADTWRIVGGHVSSPPAVDWRSTEPSE